MMKSGVCVHREESKDKSSRLYRAKKKVDELEGPTEEPES